VIRIYILKKKENMKKIRVKRVRYMRNRIRIHLCKKIKREYIKKLYKINGISDVLPDIRGEERKIIHVRNVYS
jgi:hypothetical protein